MENNWIRLGHMDFHIGNSFQRPRNSSVSVTYIFFTKKNQYFSATESIRLRENQYLPLVADTDKLFTIHGISSKVSSIIKCLPIRHGLRLVQKCTITETELFRTIVSTDSMEMKIFRGSFQDYKYYKNSVKTCPNSIILLMMFQSEVHFVNFSQFK